MLACGQYEAFLLYEAAGFLTRDVRVMKVITLASRKGGTGKTSLAINLAAIANRQGERACVVDMDPQNSIRVWKQLRDQDDELPRISMGSSRPHGLPSALVELRRRNVHCAFSYPPPNLTPAVTVAIEHADLIVIPTRPD